MGFSHLESKAARVLNSINKSFEAILDNEYDGSSVHVNNHDAKIHVSNPVARIFRPVCLLALSPQSPASLPTSKASSVAPLEPSLVTSKEGRSSCLPTHQIGAPRIICHRCWCEKRERERERERERKREYVCMHMRASPSASPCSYVWRKHKQQALFPQLFSLSRSLARSLALSLGHAMAAGHAMHEQGERCKYRWRHRWLQACSNWPQMRGAKVAALPH